MKSGAEPGAVVITAAALRVAGGPGGASRDRPFLPDRCFGRPDPAAAALGVPSLASIDHLPADPDFPGDRKAWLASACLGDLIGSVPDGARRGLYLGTGLSSLSVGELEEDLYPHLARRPDGTPERFDRASMARDLRGAAWVHRHLPERVTQALARRIGAVQAETSFSACAAAAQSIARAARAVAAGEVDVAIAGGHDSMLHALGILSFVVLGALSTGTARPFDRRRDGFLLGEGAALLQLEREADARARGAPILARWLGAGSSIDAWNVTAPHPEGRGAGLAMGRALRAAGLQPQDVDYVNAHGTGTPIGDRAEALAIARLLGDVPVSSFKGAVGHCIAAAGAVEIALCLASFQQGILPATVGLEEPDPACPANLLAAPVLRRPAVILSNSFGFGGQNCAILLGAP